jgi:arylsulfatase A-like enzyme
MEGAGLLTGSNGGPSAERDAIFTQYTNLLYAIRTHRFKLIEDTRRRSQRLYDLRRDPAERRDVAAARPEVAAELAERLDEWRRSVLVLDDLDAPSPVLDEAELKRLRTLGYLD